MNRFAHMVLDLRPVSLTRQEKLENKRDRLRVKDVADTWRIIQGVTDVNDT